jgi:hypothetical protein
LTSTLNRSVEALAAERFSASSNTYLMKVVKPEAHDASDARDKIKKMTKKLSGVVRGAGAKK